MISIISPAKKLNFSIVPIQRPVTEPIFKDEAFSLASLASELSVTELSQLMSISNNLAQLNYDRFQEFKKQPITVETKPAALAFNGDTYSGLKAEIFTSEDFESLLSGDLDSSKKFCHRFSPFARYAYYEYLPLSS